MDAHPPQAPAHLLQCCRARFCPLQLLQQALSSQQRRLPLGGSPPAASSSNARGGAVL